MFDNLQFEAEMEINEIKEACQIAEDYSQFGLDKETMDSFCHELINYKYILDLLKAGKMRRDILRMSFNDICNGKYENEVIIDIDKLEGFTSRFKKKLALNQSRDIIKSYKSLMKVYVSMGLKLTRKSAEYDCLVNEINELINILEDDSYKQDIYKAYYSETLIRLKLTNDMFVKDICLISSVDRFFYSTILETPITLSNKDQYNAGKWWADILNITIRGNVEITTGIGEVMSIVKSKSFPNSISWNCVGEIEIRSYIKKPYKYKIIAGIPEIIEDDLVLRMYYRQILDVALDNNIFTLAFYEDDISYQDAKGSKIALEELKSFAEAHPVQIYWIV